MDALSQPNFQSPPTSMRTPDSDYPNSANFMEVSYQNHDVHISSISNYRPIVPCNVDHLHISSSLSKKHPISRLVPDEKDFNVWESDRSRVLLPDSDKDAPGVGNGVPNNCLPSTSCGSHLPLKRPQPHSAVADISFSVSRILQQEDHNEGEPFNIHYILR